MLHKEIRLRTNETFTWRFYEYAMQIVPTSAAVSVYNKNGTAIVNDEACVIDADGTIHYVLPGTLITSCDVNYKVELSYSYFSSIYYPEEITQYHNELFDVVKAPLINLVTDTDLFIYLPELRDKVGEKNGTSTSDGTTSTIKDTELKSDDRNFKGGYIEIYISDSSFFRAQVTDFERSTGTVTFSPAYSTAITSGKKYFIRSSYQALIEAAFEKVRHDVRNKVKLSSGYIDGNVIKDACIYKAIEIYCGGRIEADSDKWHLNNTRFKSMYESELTKIQESFDYDEDGNISDYEDDHRPHFNSVGVDI